MLKKVHVVIFLSPSTELSIIIVYSVPQIMKECGVQPRLILSKTNNGDIVPDLVRFQGHRYKINFALVLIVNDPY